MCRDGPCNQTPIECSPASVQAFVVCAASIFVEEIFGEVSCVKGLMALSMHVLPVPQAGWREALRFPTTLISILLVRNIC